MFQLPTPEEIQKLAAEAGMSMLALCKKAGIAPSTWQRWKGREISPSLETVQKLIDALKPTQT